jgi:hypothetical protein
LTTTKSELNPTPYVPCVSTASLMSIKGLLSSL